MAVKRKKRFGGFLLTIIFCAASFAGGYYYYEWKIFGQAEYTTSVLDVVDGDTIEVEWFGGVSRLRLVGIDTLETRHNKKLREQAAEWGLSEAEAYELGQKAKKITQDRLIGQLVTIQFPSGEIERDAFGRLLAYVFHNESDYGLFLVQQGLAYTRKESHIRERYYEWPMVQSRNDGMGIHKNGL